MIDEKAEWECVTVTIDKICEDHKKMILQKQDQVRKQQNRRIGKAVALKMLLDDLIECRDGNKEV